LTNIEELFLQIGEVNFWVFVEQPHNLGCVHWRTATQRNDGVRLESSQHLSAGTNCCHAWLWFHVVDDLQRYVVATTTQHVNNFVHKTKTSHGGVGDDGHPLHIWHIAQILD